MVNTLYPMTIAFIACASHASAGIDVYNKGEQSLNLGLILRADVHDGMDSKDGQVQLPNIEIHVTATLARWLKLKYATDKDGSNTQRMMEAIVQFEPDPRFNVWAGRILLPSSRSNLSGILNLNTWLYPYASRFPAIWYGRDNGAVAWGHLKDGKLKYHIAITEGRYGAGLGRNPNHQVSGRVSYNFWDSEPGYYNKNTYYGERDIFTLGLTHERQKNAAGDGVKMGDFTGWSADLMIEKKRANGAVAGLESAAYTYDIEGIEDARFNIGTSFYTTASYLFAQKTGVGKFQPHVRYMQFDRKAKGTHRSWDIGTNYVIKGHKLRASLVYRTEKLANTKRWHDSVILGLQAIF